MAKNKGGYGKINEHPKANTNGFGVNKDNINKKGAPLSIKNTLREILNANGEITLSRKNVIEITDKSVTIRLSRRQMMVVKLMEHIESKNANTSLKALQMVSDLDMPEETNNGSNYNIVFVTPNTNESWKEHNEKK